MARHLKSRIISRLSGIISYFVPKTDISASPARGVRYFVPVESVKFFWGAMNTVKEGRRCKKHIIVRNYPRYRGVLQLYTYHFPKTWSAACVANRELIKTAQRLAHALEHDTSRAGLEWKLRFLKHYFTVCVGGAKPEPGLKRYSRFYQYTYVSIYRELQSARQPQKQEINIDDITVEPLGGSSVNPINQRSLPANIIRRHFHSSVHPFTPSSHEIDPPDITPFIPPNRIFSPNPCVYQKFFVPLHPVWVHSTKPA